MARLDAFQKQDLRTVTLGSGDEVVHIVFDAEALSPRWQRRLAEAETNPVVLVEALHSLIESWDFVDADGTPLPLTVEVLSGFSYRLLGQIMGAISEAAMPTEEEGKASSSPSETAPLVSTPPSPASPNGTTTSSSPTVSASPFPT